MLSSDSVISHGFLLFHGGRENREENLMKLLNLDIKENFYNHEQMSLEKLT